MSATTQWPSGLTHIDVQQHDLSIAGREVIQDRVEFTPEYASFKHFHPGEEVMYLLEGQLEYQIEGQPPRTVGAGEGLTVPPETVHEVSNVGGGKASGVVTYIVEKGEPLITFVD